MKYDKIITKALREILNEQSESEPETEEPSKNKKKSKNPENSQGVISTAGAFGSGGRSKAFVAQAGARADNDPEGLMKDLGITDVSDGDDLSATLKILRTAIYSNLSMSEAYIGAKIGRERDKPAIQISMSKLDRKNGVRFLAHTLKAAQNAGFLNLKGGLQFAIGQGSDIAVFSI